jgi:adenine-specific DNA-methyltransferase
MDIVTEIKNDITSSIQRNKYDQYFTTNVTLQKKVFDLILNEPDVILEPSVGRGDLVKYVMENSDMKTFDMYEIDNTVKLLDGVDIKNVTYCDFLKQVINKKYKTIIGNPPYGKLYVLFIQKCFNLLEENGELIFIIPSDFFKLTRSVKLLNEMMTAGSFTHIYHPNNEKLFEFASIDVIIFRYCKDKNLPKRILHTSPAFGVFQTLYNDKIMNIHNSNGLITFSEYNIGTKELISNHFEIYVGLVSGKEEVFKNEKFGNLYLLNGVNKKDKYIFLKKFPTSNDELNKYMLDNKKELIERQIRNFTEKNWFEWGAIRNEEQMNSFTYDIELEIDKLSLDEYYNKCYTLSKSKPIKVRKCIYVYTLTRKEQIAFIDDVGYFGGNLIMMKPKKEYDLNKIVNFLNSDEFKHNFIYSNRFKIGHRQLANSAFPVNLIV